MRLFQSVAAVVLFLLATDASAGVREDAIAAHDRKDFADVLRLLHVLADEKDSWGMLHLGHVYASGEGVVADLVEAAKWYRKAAEQGDASAQYSLARAYDVG
ncbi:MAG: sel1 repeat family protein, partial [Bradyrhizobium sp.]|nr:sel1 repeat family protein [Bradyrhizobium sp.]